MMEKYAVTIINEEEDSRFLCSEDHDLLTGSERAGCRCLPQGCRRGGCGVCRVQVVEGSVEPIREMSAEYISADDLENGYVLACCVRPRRSVTVRTAQKK